MFFLKFGRTDSATEILTALGLPVFDTLLCERKYKFSQLISDYCSNTSSSSDEHFVPRLLAAYACDNYITMLI